MALYTFRCDYCGHEQDIELPMSDKKEPRACPRETCPGPMRRVFKPYALQWRNAQGELIRSPSRPWDWEDGRPMDYDEFKRRNPTAGDVGSNTNGRR